MLMARETWGIGDIGGEEVSWVVRLIEGTRYRGKRRLGRFKRTAVDGFDCRLMARKYKMRVEFPVISKN